MRKQRTYLVHEDNLEDLVSLRLPHGRLGLREQRVPQTLDEHCELVFLGLWWCRGLGNVVRIVRLIDDSRWPAGGGGGGRVEPCDEHHWGELCEQLQRI